MRRDSIAPRLRVAAGVASLLTLAVGIAWATTIYNLRVTKTATITCPFQPTRVAMLMYSNTSEWTLTSANYGRVYDCPGLAGQAITLPANGAASGSWMMFLGTGSDAYAPVFNAATADTLIGPNDAGLDSVTYASGHRIGLCLMLISNGTCWTAINVGSTTMTGSS